MATSTYADVAGWVQRREIGSLWEVGRGLGGSLKSTGRHSLQIPLTGSSLVNLGSSQQLSGASRPPRLGLAYFHPSLDLPAGR